jgi:Na+-translocating ferredoxin:NAD+ oxidoreductase RnfE subunit
VTPNDELGLFIPLIVAAVIVVVVMTRYLSTSGQA